MSKIVWCATFDLGRETDNTLTDFEHRAIVNVYSISQSREDFLFKAARSLLIDRFKDITLEDEPFEVDLKDYQNFNDKEVIEQSIRTKEVSYGTFYSYTNEES